MLTVSSAISTRTVRPTMLSAPQKIVVCGLDGVLVDTEPATSRCAWLTASELWPEIMAEAAAVPAEQAGVRRAWVGGDWSALTGEVDGMPSWLSAKLKQLRPVVRDAHDATLLARLCADEALAASRASRGSRPLSVGEIEGGWDGELRELLASRYGVAPEELRGAFEEASSEWRRSNPDSWRDANRLYDGADAALRRGLAEPDSRLVLLTRRSAAEALELLEAPGAVEVLEREEGASKADALATLRRAHPEASIRFVDDSASTLLGCAADARLLPVGLHFCAYGYASASQRALTGAVPRLRTVERSCDLESSVWGDFKRLK